jgi:hypothetical protein
MRIESKSWLIENSKSILKNIKVRKKSNLFEEYQLQQTGHGWFKESLVVYFSTMVSDSDMKKVEHKLSLSDKDQQNVKLKLPQVTNFDRYGNGKSTLPNAISHLMEDVVKTNEKKFYYNAISIAKLIRSIYGGKVDPKKIDMGTVYDSIRSKAVELSRGMELEGMTPDKWCPADIYIYNDLSVPRKAVTAKTLNIGENSLNSFFQSDAKKTSSGILGISLKEEKAQAGAATSFKNILTREQNYPALDKIKNYDALSVIYHYDNFVENPNKSYYFSNLAYAYASAKKLDARGINGAKDMISALEKTFESTLGEYLPSKTRTGAYSPTSIKQAFEKSGAVEVSISSKMTESIEKIVESVRKDATKQFLSERKKFIDDLKSYGFNPPTKLLSPDKLTIQKILTKSGCYRAASYVLKGMSSGAMSIPPTFSTIAKQKNPFVAMVAFAIGMGGISPTFFKMIGSSRPEGVAHIEPFYGNGFLNLEDKTDVSIIDSENRAGFGIEYIAKVTLEDSKKSKTLKKYKVKINYHSAGDQIIVLVNEFKEA